MSLIRYLMSYSISGTVMSSSRVAINRLTDDNIFARAKVIVELGGGTGKVSREILQKMNADAKLYCFEIQHNFADELRNIGDPRLCVINDSAVNILQHLPAGSADLIISTLPLSFFRRAERISMLSDCHDVLKTNGILRHLSFLYFPRYFSGIFHSVKTEFQIIGMPPAILYLCLK
ncbi:methyltransferase domain-containing protein [Chitinophaga oryzae]|uniref:Methyltransferase domain-containing protein n=1 Tax=Chitinophaga oryzae TaxID=2725414 RepID=A0AAE6ZHC7_9BACT|nr:methyltransferase domain-containing protein [Chitinophaga oryzae]QJB32212.1 methyltransferase domain-containing protein [Chitinophaga oryzae]